MPADAWVVVAACGAATVAIKGAGPVLLGGRRLPPVLLRCVALLAPALLAALVAPATFGGDRRLLVDERALGVAAAAVAAWRGLPVLAVVVVAAVATAAARAVS